MKKHAFTLAQRYAIWHFHGTSDGTTRTTKCHLCHEPITFKDLTCDHVIPERLLEKPEELSLHLKKMGLPSDFKINDFNNWKPAHLKCNQEKGGDFEPTQLTESILRRLMRDSEEIRRVEQDFIKKSKKEVLEARITDALENGTLTPRGIENLFPKGRPAEDEYIVALHDACLHVDPQRWKLVGSSDIATVTDGKFRGITPVSQCPHISWLCPRCLHYGPWNGNKCMTCGMMSDPND